MHYQLPMDIDSYMRLCTENVSQGDIKTCCVGVGPKPWEIKRKLLATKVSLRQRRKLYCDEDGHLFRRSGPYSQLVLPQKFYNIVFKHLHEKMGNLGASRVEIGRAHV